MLEMRRDSAREQAAENRFRLQKRGEMEMSNASKKITVAVYACHSEFCMRFRL